MFLSRALQIALLAVLLLTLACASTSQAVNEDVKTLRGIVIEAEGASITDLQRLVIEDEIGRRWTFQAEGFVGETPSHLKQHAITREPITVRYRERTDGTLVTIQVTDDPSG